MKIDEEKCIGCFECIDYCPVGAIKEGENTAYIEQDECVECGVCLKVAACALDALYQPLLEWPRILRSQFSDPRTVHPATMVYGRGTDESKTNEITNRYPRGYVGIAAELGRPCIGTRLKDVEKVAKAILPLGVEFEKDNPTYYLFEDVKEGKMRADVLNERVLSAILEFKVPLEKVSEVLNVLRKVADEIETVMSIDIGAKLDPDGSNPAVDIARNAGFNVRPNGKTNLGLGRPLTIQGA
jgi:NAD-dependent dihydropyrimidine dehydrogenase PreA subunit